jgi:D-alanyl-D-alanine carboxypeptidase
LDQDGATVRLLSPRDRPVTRLLSVLAAVLVAVAASLAFVTPAYASTQFAGKEITAAFPSGEPDPPAITAAAAILIDMDSGRILYSRNANDRLPMASTTKIMTAVVALESLKLEANVTI